MLNKSETVEKNVINLDPHSDTKKSERALPLSDFLSKLSIISNLGFTPEICDLRGCFCLPRTRTTATTASWCL